MRDSGRERERERDRGRESKNDHRYSMPSLYTAKLIIAFSTNSYLIEFVVYYFDCLLNLLQGWNMRGQAV